MNRCVCGHDRYLHDFREGCVKFLCCNRTRNLYPGMRHTEHDGINHTVDHCQCTKFLEAKDRWQEDIEAGAIG